RATIFRLVAQVELGAEDGSRWCDIVIYRIVRAIEGNRPYLFVAALLVTCCATTSTHRFAEPAREWETRSGQLLYRNPKTTVIGDALIRFSKAGDFELTFSKGPVTLFILRQDAIFADVKGPLAGRGWSGPINRAPQ